MWNWLLVKLGLRTDWSNPDLAPPPSSPRFSSDDLYHAALDVLYPILGSRCCSVGTLEGATQTQREIDRLRVWVRTLEDKRIRYHYGYWLDHFENELARGLRDLITHQGDREMQRYREREHEKAVQRLPAKEWIPKPPRPEIPSGGTSVE